MFKLRHKMSSNNAHVENITLVIRVETRQCAPPPEIIFRGPLKFFSMMVMQKSEPRRGDAKLRGLGACPQKILRNLTLFWRHFVRFEPLKFLSFNKV